MTTSRFGNKFLRISGYVLGFLLVALVAFHFWFKAHARQLIEDLVESRSNGTIKLKVEKFTFNWFSKKMEFQDAVFYSTDSITASTSYRFSVAKIKLKVDAILPIVFSKRIIIDTLTLLDPEIRVTRLKRSERKETGIEKDVSIPEEMGKIYNSIQDALKVLRVSRFLIDRGTFTLVNNIQEGQRPIRISNIFFQIDNLSVDTTIQGARDKILFSDNVILRSHEQDIVFPDERHRLSFSKFSINLQQKLVEFDSCTIAAIRTDSSSAAFTMYMDALKLIDIDFDTLYKTEVIKADSVYVVNPKFNLAVELGRKKDGSKPAPKLEDIIKQLTGDLQLDNVVVSNADFNINTVKDGIPSSYTFSKNNFDMEGLTIDQDAAIPIKVKSFSMAIRNYENFIRDSSYSVQFDSVLFRNDQIYLSNFVFHKLDGGRVINTFNIPQFYLGGLSWDDLVFERKLKADQATLFNPRINYTVSDKLRNKSGKASVFQSLASINEMMDLGYLDIIDGNIDLKVNDDIRIQLDQATLSIQSRDLLQSTQIAGIKNSLTALDFRDGIIHAGDVVIKLKDIRYLGETGHFTAGILSVNDLKNNLVLEVKDVYVDKLLIDEKRGDIFSENISWKSGQLKLRSAGAGKNFGSILDIRNVHGRDTRLTGEFGKFEMTTFLNELKFERLDKRPGQPLHIAGLVANGADLKLRQDRSTLGIGTYVFTDMSSSSLNDITYQRSASNGTTNISVPSITLVPFFETYISGKFKFDDVVFSQPKIEAELSGVRSEIPIVPEMEINSLTLERPNVNYKKTKPDGTLFSLQWNAENSPRAMVITDLHNRSNKGWDLVLQKLNLQLQSFNLLTQAGKKFNTGNGSLEAEFRDIRLLDQKEGMDWQATISELRAKDILLDSVGKKKNRLYIGQLLLQELGLNTGSITNLENLTKANAKFRIKGFDGELSNSQSILNWYQASLSRPEKTFSLDSMRWEPRLGMDSFMSKQLVQKDYVKLHTGAVRLKNADIEGFIRDNRISGNTMQIDDAVLSITRDTRLRFDSGRIKSLPVNILRKLDAPVGIDVVDVRNGKVFYSEIAANGAMATIPISNLNVKLTNVKNEDFNTGDSLFADISGNIFDSARVYLQIRESYLDSLSGFTLDAQFGPTRIGVLNPAFVPLGSLYIRSGQLDTATLRVVAHEYLAFGEMKMEFRDLKLQLLKEPGNIDKKNTKKLLTFLANSFVIRNKNNQNPGIVFVIRNRERSIFNYLVKIATRGFQSSIGVGNNKKLTRQYKDEIKKKGLPQIE